MIDKIIDSLTSDGNLTTPLLKTLAFARRIGNNELANWVSNELNGYDTTSDLPGYRFTKTIVQGKMRQDGMLTQEISLPLSCFGEKYSKHLIKRGFYESITTLEDIATNEKQYIVKEFAADLCNQLSLQAKGNGCNFTVVTCKQLVAIFELKAIITGVRTKLLELLLKIEASYPEINEKNASINKDKLNSSINYMMGNIYNINTNGDGSVINTGNKNELNINNSFGQRDLKVLQDQLAFNGVDKSDIAEISTIVTEEQPINNSLGQRAKDWITKMIGKAVNETWKIGVGVGAKLIEETVKHYYGIK